MMHPEAEKLLQAGKLSRPDAEKLSKIPVGTFVVHKSWGPGRIAEWDFLGDRLVVDFEDKKGHPLKLAFAIGSLEVLPEEHLLARRVGDLDGLKALAKNNPAELVETTLKSYGNTMSLDAFEALIIPRIVPAAEYKAWWSTAKKALKDRRHIVVPIKRTEMLARRHVEGVTPAQAMIEDLAKARDLRGKLNALGRIQTDLDLFSDRERELAPAFDEISNTVRKSWKLNLKETLQLLLARDELAEVAKVSMPEGSLKIEELLRDARPLLAEASANLPAGLLSRFYRAFPTSFPDRAWVQESLNHLTKTGGRAVGEIAAVLDANDELDQLAEFLKRSVRNRMLSTDLLIWMCKERKGKSESVFDIDLGNAILSALEDDNAAGGPKRVGRLHDVFAEDPGLLGEMVKDADDDELRLFTRRILGSQVFDDLTRRSLMGRLIKARPETQELVENNTSRLESALVVSWESMEKRKVDLEDLVKNQIPQNKKDIQIAREYGDLRENFEYKSARQQQAVLLRLQSKYERELRNARGTDFVGVSTETVGIGTVVTFEDVATGEKQTHSILGAWDGDPDKHILSYLSEMAKALVGKKVGDETDLPTETDALRHVRIVEIRPYIVA